MVTGSQYIGSDWYYFSSEGHMYVNQWLEVKDSNNVSYWYYYKPDGKMAKGLQQVGDYIYYFNSSGAMQTGWQHIGDYYYYFDCDDKCKRSSL